MRLREKHDLLEATYEEALGTLKDPIIVDNVACAPNSTIDQALLIEENNKLKWIKHKVSTPYTLQRNGVC
jgi:hypothetical protein